MAESKAAKLVDDLKQRGVNYSVLFTAGTVIMVGPGAPFTTIPTPYNEADLNDAIKQGLLRKTEWTVAGAGMRPWTVESYVALEEVPVKEPGFQKPRRAITL
jgi:hypothetical protein